MNRKLFYFFLTAHCLLFVSCSKTPMERLEVILGTWEGLQDDSYFIEDWKKVSDGHYKASGTGMIGSDTVFKEVLSIELIEDVPYYIANPENTGAVHFKLVSEKDNVFTFEKKDHDFPQEIIYAFKGQDSLLVQLLGIRDNQKAVQQMYFTRKK